MMLSRRRHAQIDALAGGLIVGAGICAWGWQWTSYPVALLLVLAGHLSWSRFWRAR